MTGLIKHELGKQSLCFKAKSILKRETWNRLKLRGRNILIAVPLEGLLAQIHDLGELTAGWKSINIIIRFTRKTIHVSPLECTYTRKA